MTISSASPAVHRVLTITGLLDLFGMAGLPNDSPAARTAHAQAI